MESFVPGGVMTALVTPFHPDGSINWDILPQLIDYQIAAGVTGIAVTAGSGEFVTLKPDERQEVVRRAAAAIGGRVPLIAGVLAADTGSSVEASLAAQEAGADALLVLTPYYVSPSADGLIEHFQQVVEAVSCPVILYNIPARTNINLDLPVLAPLSELPGVVAIKECDRDLGRVAWKIKNLGERIAFLSGDDDLCVPFWSIGGTGAIMSSTNLTAPLAVACFEAARAGDWDRAREIFTSKLLPFILLYRGRDHPGQLKQALGIAGFPVGTGRAPLHPAGPERLAAIERGMRELGLLDLVQRPAAGAASSD